MDKEEQEKAVRLINRHYFEALLLRETKICLVKDNYRVGIYTICGSQNESILNIIKNIYKTELFGTAFNIDIIENDIIIDFNNGSTIKILDYHNKERGNRFNEVIINNMICHKDVYELIEPKIIKYNTEHMFYCQFE